MDLLKNFQSAFLELISKIKKNLEAYGVVGTCLNLADRYKLRLPLTVKLIWKGRIRSEVAWWDDFLRTQGLEWPEEYQKRFDPERPLQARVAALLPPLNSVSILDVGAGPLTYLGKMTPKKQIHITAVDPLSDGFNVILRKRGLTPIVRTQKADAEKLSQLFSPNTFDLVFARNCIDHSYDPETAILEMLKIVKKDCYVLMEHHPEEGDKNQWSGLHQWNFSATDNGELLLVSKKGIVENLTKKLKDLCEVNCEVLTESGERWLIARLRKK